MTARASLTAAGLCVPIMVALAAPASPAPQLPPPPPRPHTGHASASGINLTVSIDDMRWYPAGNRALTGMLFSHDARVHGRYSITAAAGSIQSGTAAAGFIVGCGVSAGGGIQIGLTPSAGVNAGLQPSITLTAPPSVSIAPSVGANAGMSEGDQLTLEPGQVTAVVVANATLTSTSTYPYRLSFDDAAINVSQCISPGTAVPFITASVSTNSATVQTAAYGDQFTF